MVATARLKKEPGLVIPNPVVIFEMSQYERRNAGGAADREDFLQGTRQGAKPGEEHQP